MLAENGIIILKITAAESSIIFRDPKEYLTLANLLGSGFASTRLSPIGPIFGNSDIVSPISMTEHSLV